MSNSTISWKPDPDFRGTFNILSTCLGTLFICVWSAVHDDVTKGKKGFRVTLRRIGWLIVGLLGPELLLFISYRQWWEARRILREAEQVFEKRSPASSGWRQSIVPHWLQRFFSDDKSDTGSSSITASDKSSETPSEKGVYGRKYPWTLTHAFWVVMGGFKLSEKDDEGKCYLPAWQGEALVTPEGMRFLLKHAPHLIPDISTEEIMDRSKADGLAKGLLVLQVLWFCINCGTRLAQRLPLSLLEVSTIAHGASTLLTYCFWWKKPFNVREPILINCKTEEEASIGASMSVFSGAGHNVLCGLMCLREESEGTSLACISVNSLVLEAMDEESQNFTPDAREFASEIYSRCSSNFRGWFMAERSVHVVTSNSSSGTLDWRRPWHLLVHSLRVYKAKFIYRGQPSWHSPVNEGCSLVKVDPTCLRRWRLAGIALRCIDMQLEEMYQGSHYPFIVPVATLQSSLDMFSNTTSGRYIHVAVSSILPAVYGILHLLGWNIAFPTHTEKVLWRIAALAVTVSGAATNAFALPTFLISHHFEWNRLAKYAMRTPLVVLIPYVIASGYLLVESFRQLFALPPGAFQLASWTNTIPHFA